MTAHKGMTLTFGQVNMHLSLSMGNMCTRFDYPCFVLIPPSYKVLMVEQTDMYRDIAVYHYPLRLYGG